MRFQRSLRSQEGFTLPELLAVIAILGVLAGIVTHAVVGIGDTSQRARLAGDENIIGTAVDRWLNASFSQSYPVVPFEDTDPALTEAGDLGVRLIDFYARLPQDPGQTFTPDFIKQVPESASMVSWRIDEESGLVFYTIEGAPLIPPSESRLNISPLSAGKKVVSGYLFEFYMYKYQAAVQVITVEVPEKYTLSSMGLPEGTQIGTLTGTISEDNPWRPGESISFTGKLLTSSIPKDWRLFIDYPDFVNVLHDNVPGRHDSIHGVSVIEPSSNSPGALIMMMDRSDDTEYYTIADETWQLQLYGSVVTDRGMKIIIANPSIPGVYRWTVKENTTIDAIDIFDDVPGNQSIIIE